MAHTLPDYASKYKHTRVFAGVDVYELAVRLGSIVSYDRKGTVIMLEDFESTTLKWDTAINGSGSSINLSTETAKNGDCSCKLVAGAAGGAYARIHKQIRQIRGTTLGVEMSFTLNSGVDRISIKSILRTGSTQHYSGVQYDYSGKRIQYYDNNQAWQTISGQLDLVAGDYTYNTVKYVIDTDLKEYREVSLNAVDYNVSGYKYYAHTDTASPRTDILIECDGTGTTTGTSHIDDIIITEYE